jgi:hypothetical protein
MQGMQYAGNALRPKFARLLEMFLMKFRCCKYAQLRIAQVTTTTSLDTFLLRSFSIIGKLSLTQHIKYPALHCVIPI